MSISRLSVLASGLIVLLLSPLVWSQTTAPAALATTAPSRYTVMVPAGMQSITVAGRTALCMPDIADAVRSGLGKVKPTQRPTTMPSDILARLAAVRPTLVKEMNTDLLVSPDSVNKFLDENLVLMLKEMSNLHADTYIVVATQDQITAAEKQGWHAPMFHYNQLANQTSYEARITVSTAGAMDDVVLWAAVQPGASPDEIAGTVAKVAQDFEGGFVGASSQESLLQSRNLFIGFIAQSVAAPLKLPVNEQWFALGMMGTMSCKYTAEITGIPRLLLVAGVTADNRNNPIKAPQLDLLRPFDPNAVKRQYLPLLVEAISRKASWVVQRMLIQAGDSAMPKIIAALKVSVPADNLGLVKLIHDQSGVDVTNDLLPQ
jgi:hypothetical protein